MALNILNPPADTKTALPATSRLGYLPALDGLRALAVLAVILYHADVLWLPGGFLGVEIFFVVSGYLITSLLLAEYRAHNSIDLKRFWQRRARRLLPALFAMILAVLVFTVAALPDEVASLRGDVVAAFTYITNWYLILGQQSYFETMGRPSLLRHLWSLAVEEQFYLVWPLIFVFLLTRLQSRAAMILLMVGATASALWMGALFQPDADPSRIYYGTDTRAAGLLIGAALAFAWMPRAGEKPASRFRRWTLDLVGVAALGALIVACLALSEFDPFLYQGGMLLVGAATALVIAAVVTPQSPFFASVLGFGVLRWIGLRSYSLYLWHWPIFMVTRPQLDTTLDGTPLLALRLVATLALAEFSYRAIETPIRSGALGKLWDGWNAFRGARRWSSTLAGVVAVAVSLVGAYALTNAVVLAQPPQEPDYVLMTPEEEGVSPLEMQSTGDVVLDESGAPLPDESALLMEPDATSSDLSPVSFLLGADKPANPIAGLVSPSAMDSWLQAFDTGRQPPPESTVINDGAVCNAQCQKLEFAQLKQGIIRPSTRSVSKNPVVGPTANGAVVWGATAPRKSDAQILAIGDSVMLGATLYFGKAGLNVNVDAKTGRQVSTAIKLLQERKDANLLAPVVLIHLGNNGTFSSKQLDQIMTVLEDVPRVIFVNTKVPRKWQEPNNTALSQGVRRYPNAQLLDWNAASNQHAEWFWQDGIHLRPEGALVYANLVAQVINQPIP